MSVHSLSVEPLTSENHPPFHSVSVSVGAVFLKIQEPQQLCSLCMTHAETHAGI